MMSATKREPAIPLERIFIQDDGDHRDITIRVLVKSNTAIGKSCQSRQYKLKLKFEKTKCHLGGGILAQTTMRFSVVKGPIARLCFVPVLAQQ